jgi:hypothetical protein
MVDLEDLEKKDELLLNQATAFLNFLHEHNLDKAAKKLKKTLKEEFGKLPKEPKGRWKWVSHEEEEEEDDDNDESDYESTDEEELERERAEKEKAKAAAAKAMEEAERAAAAATAAAEKAAKAAALLAEKQRKKEHITDEATGSDDDPHDQKSERKKFQVSREIEEGDGGTNPTAKKKKKDKKADKKAEKKDKTNREKVKKKDEGDECDSPAKNSSKPSLDGAAPVKTPTRKVLRRQVSWDDDVKEHKIPNVTPKTKQKCYYNKRDIDRFKIEENTRKAEEQLQKMMSAASDTMGVALPAISISNT